MTETPFSKSSPTTADFFVGLAVALLALGLPVFVLSLLLLCIVVAGMGSSRFGHFVTGLVFAIFALRFPVAVLFVLLVCLTIILAGKWLVPKLRPTPLAG
jgi:hypothetical protein